MIVAHTPMTVRPTSAALALALAACAIAATPRPARALQLLDEELSLDLPGSRAVAAAIDAGVATPPAAEEAARPTLLAALDAQGVRAPLAGALLAAAPPPGSMDFDLLGTPKAPPDTSKEDARMKSRRKYLQAHQRVGLGVLALELATVVVGQLNYNDKFGDANTGKYVMPHKVLAYTTFGVFAIGGTLALLAPTPKDRPNRGWDRVRVHKLGMLLATAGMVAQAVYGIQTRNREGYLDQQDIAKTHLYIGYATLAATGVAVGALVF
jgi:hypothetical protein